MSSAKSLQKHWKISAVMRQIKKVLLPRRRSRRNNTPSAYDFSSGLTVLKEKNILNDQTYLREKKLCSPHTKTHNNTWWGWWRRESGPWLLPGYRHRSHTGRSGKTPGSPALDISLEPLWRAHFQQIYTSTPSGSVNSQWTHVKPKVQVKIK